MNNQNILITVGTVFVIAIISLLLYLNPLSESPETELKLSSDQISSLLGITDNKSVKIGDIEAGRGGVRVKSISLKGKDNAEIEIHDVDLQIRSTEKLVYSISLLKIGKVDILDWKTAQRVQAFDVEVDKPSDGFLTNLEEAFSSANSGESIKTAGLLCARLGIGRIEYMARSNEENITKVSIEGFSINDALSDKFGDMRVTRISFGDIVSGKNLKITKVNRNWADQLLALLTTSESSNSSTKTKPTITTPTLNTQDTRIFPFDRIEIGEISLVANKLPPGDKLGNGLVKISNLTIGFDQSSNGRMSGAKMSVSATIPTELFWSGSDKDWNKKALDFFSGLDGFGNTNLANQLNLTFQLNTDIEEDIEDSNISLDAPGILTISLKTKTRGVMNSLGKLITLQNSPSNNTDAQLGISSLALKVSDDGILSYLFSDRFKDRDSISNMFRMVLLFFPQEQNRLSAELEGFLIAPSRITLTGDFGGFISDKVLEALSESHLSFIAANPKAVAAGKAIAEAQEKEKELKKEAEAQAAKIAEAKQKEEELKKEAESQAAKIIEKANQKAKEMAESQAKQSSSQEYIVQPTPSPQYSSPASPLALDSGHRWLMVASRPTLEEAASLAYSFKSKFKNTQIFLSDNGWYAITVGTVEYPGQKYLKDQWISGNLIPSDSYFTSGSKFKEEVSW